MAMAVNRQALQTNPASLLPLQLSPIHLFEHPHEHRPERPILLAVDQ
jgi:hypothetical protein